MELAANPALDRHLIRATPRLSPDGYSEGQRRSDEGSQPVSIEQSNGAKGRSRKNCYKLALPTDVELGLRGKAGEASP